MSKESEKEGVWVPQTPAKPIPERPNLFSPISSQEEYYDYYWLRSTSRKIAQAVETEKKNADCYNNGGPNYAEHSKSGGGLVSRSASMLSKKFHAKKRCNDGMDLNKKPGKRTKVIKNYRPKVVVEGKPNRTSKDSKPVTPNCSPSKKRLSRKRKSGRKNSLKASDKSSEDNKEKIFGSVQLATRSCRQLLNFNLKITATDDIPINSNLQTYNGREQNLEITDSNESGTQSNSLQVHRRRIFQKDYCLSNSRKVGSIFPRICKRNRRTGQTVTQCHILETSICDHKSQETSIEVHSHEEAKTMGTNSREISVQEVFDFVVAGSQEISAEEAESLEISNEDSQLMVQNKNENSPQSGKLTLVPYKVPSDPNKKEYLRPKVELDEETMRVWKLLMEKDECEASKEESKDKEKWWEQERELFRGRAAWFISRMHLIQGDRHFSAWKGSVVDSVVGAFLSQNVDDTLSSSAFMALAARYPFRTVCDVPIPQKVSTSSTGAMDGTHISSAYTSAENLATKEPRGSKRLGHDLKGPFSSTSSSKYDKGRMSLKGKRPVEEKEVRKLDSRKKFGRKLEKEDNKLGSRSSLRRERRKIKKNKGIKKIRTNLRRKQRRVDKNGDSTVHWDSLRTIYSNGEARDRNGYTLDSVDWNAVRSAEVDEVSKVIKFRGMNNKLALRIKKFLDRVVKDHEIIDLEWLRNVPPDKAKEYLLSIEGLGLKSVECIRLLTLKHLAFPVDRNVGRVAVRLGWVPIQPLPEAMQIHLLKQYPMVNSIQKYLWPRLCTIDQGTLYELHYQMITFGKVFCTKKKPNCNACPLKGECKHFASEFASAMFSLTGPQENNMIACSNISSASHESDAVVAGGMSLCLPIAKVPPTLELECAQTLERDIEDHIFIEEDIPRVRLNTEQFMENIHNYIDENNIPFQEGDISKALVVLTSEAASIPVPVLKNISRLRTEHQVYELPDSHPLLEKLDNRDSSDICPYLLAIWTTVEGEDVFKPLEERCDSHKSELNNESSSDNRTEDRETIAGTLLIPCRTAIRGKFPLNGTYFQVNEVFADDESSQRPINVPRSWIWDLTKRTLYCGTSVRAIVKGLSTKEIQRFFWRGMKYNFEQLL